MRVLHLFANWKWTGPAEPAVLVAERLADRFEIRFAGGRCPHADLRSLVRERAAQRGLVAGPDLSLRKHAHPLFVWRDARRLAGHLAVEPVDLLHCHLPADHLVAALARARVRGPRPRIVRSVYGPSDLAARRRSRFLFGRATDAVAAASGAAARAVEGTPFAGPLVVAPTPVDVERLQDGDPLERRSRGRRLLGLSSDHVACGIVARVQPHRRFDLLLGAFAKAAAEEERLRLVVVGRGTRYRELLERPAAELGLGGRLVKAGYLEGSDYVDVLHALDLGVFLVPGSDGSCRAARELQVCGVPTLVTEREPLGEIVEEGATGRVLPEEPEAFAAALLELARDEGMRRRMGEAARRRGRRLFHPEASAAAVAELYERVLAGSGA